MAPQERHFAFTLSVAHGADHFFKRLLPPLLPIWAVTFGFPLWKLGLLLGLITFGSALGQTPMGMLSDRYDRRHLLSGGLAVIGASAVLLGLAPGLDLGIELVVGDETFGGPFLVMLLAALCIGLGDSAFHPVGYPLISRNVNESRKGRVLGMWGSSAKLGDGIAPAAVGVLLLLVGWNSILLGLGLLGVVYAAYLFVVLGAFETRPGPVARTAGGAPEPTFDVWRADRRVYIYPMLAVFAFFTIRSLVSSGVNVFIPQFITDVYGYSFAVFGFAVTPESTASFYYAALLIAAGLIQLGTGELVDRYDHRRVLLAFLAVGTATLVVISTVLLSPLALFVALIVLGASLWGFAPARDALISDIAPADREGRTFGYLWTSAMVTSSISPVLIGYIGDIAGLQLAFAVLAVVTVASAVPIVLLLSERFYVNVDDLTDRGVPRRAD